MTKTHSVAWRKRRRPQSPWARLAGAGGATFFTILAVASLGDLVVSQSPASGCPESVPSIRSLSGTPRRLVRFYVGASRRYSLGTRGPSVLAAINEVESDFGRSQLPGVHSGTNSAGAAGPMQFLLSTWRRYGVDGDRDGRADVYDPADAIYAAARYLRASGAPHDWYGAIFAYNHADWYVAKVLRIARSFGDPGPIAETTCATSGSADLKRAVRLDAPRAFKAIPRSLMAPGYTVESVDARIWPDVIWVLRRYRLRVIAAREAGHNTHGDGTAVDMIPAGDSRSQAAWDRSAGRLAHDLGWRPECGASGSRPVCHLVPAIQFIGYDGYPNHGSPRTCTGSCPEHIHVSWVSSSFGSSALSPPPDWVLVFPVPGARSQGSPS